MEVMIVTAIIAILAAIAVPNVITWRMNAQFNSATRMVKTNIERMRMMAIKNNTRSDITFVNGATTFTTTRRNQANNAVAQVNQVQQLPPGVTLTSTFNGGQLNFNNRGMAFDPVGAPNPGTVTINGPNHQYCENQKKPHPAHCGLDARVDSGMEMAAFEWHLG